MKMARQFSVCSLAAVIVMIAFNDPAEAERRRSYRPRTVPHPIAWYGGAFLASEYGNRPYGFTARNSEGLPVFYYSRPSHYRMTIDGVHPRSRFHRWYEIR